MIIGGEQAVPAGAFLVLLGVPILPGDTVLADAAVDHRIIVPRDDGLTFLTMLGFHVRSPACPERIEATAMWNWAGFTKIEIVGRDLVYGFRMISDCWIRHRYEPSPGSVPVLTRA
ncbi:MAG: hypothetical protein MPJ25_00325 [Pirellulales bacterium]|nr:hypothetical protein [Pirellulales bacterium]